MLRPRIIPCLLLSQGSLVKTVGFTDPKYVGDPLNAVRIYNEKEADELIVLDILATKNKTEPDWSLIKNLAAECRMPLCYGGGITKSEEVVKLVSMGVEKIAICSAALDSLDLISESANKVGNQSLVVVLDLKKNSKGKWSLWSHSGTKESELDPYEFVKMAQEAGAGEILLNNIEQDGKMQGYDLDLIRKFRASHSLPMTVLGGASSLDNIKTLFKEFGLIGAAAGSLFVFKGIYKAVLINYPSREKKLCS